jgi:hypothetical protein
MKPEIAPPVPKLPFMLRHAFELVLLTAMALIVALVFVAQTLEARDGVFPTMLALAVSLGCIIAMYAAVDAYSLRLRIDRARAVGGIIVWRCGRVVDVIGGGQ